MAPTASSSRPTILVTGASGYIGSHTALACINAGYRVVTIDNFHNSSPISLDRVEQLALEALPADASEADKAACRVDLYKGDITNKDDIERMFIDYSKYGGIWGTIHLAAHKAVGESGQKPLQYYENNITGTINLLSIMDKHNTKRFVFSSSATVYGCPKVIPIPETSPMQAESCYGRTKVMTEQILKDLCDSQPNEWRAIALRYFNPAGAHPSGRIGEDPVGKPGNLLPLMAQVATGRLPQSAFKVFGKDYPTPDGTCLRDYIHVVDLAQGHVDALRALPNDDIFKADPSAESSGFGGSGGKYKMYNLGKGKGLSVLDMVAAMEKATGFKFEAEIVGRRLGDVPDLTANPALAEKELGFKAPRTLEDMCNDLWNWQSKNPKGYNV